MSLQDDFQNLATEAAAAFLDIRDSKALEETRIAFLGKKGSLKKLMGRMGEVDKADRPVVGKAAKEADAAIREAFEQAQKRVESESLDLSPEEQLRQERLDKLKRLEEKLGPGAAWGERFADTESIEAIRNRFPAEPAKEESTSEEKVTYGTARLAARVMLRRDQSKKLIFLTVQDQGGQIQIALWNQKLNEETLELIRDTLDLWDLVGVEGELAYTNAGEPTIWATSFKILTKCISPPAEKHHGLQDKETRYRQRYLDLITNTESRKTFVLRAKAVSSVRRFLDDQGFLEMETPTLQTIPGGAAARPFETYLNALNLKMYMRIATEVPLKKLLVGGLERVYELGRIFRNEGIDFNHNPEFTTVEIYQAYGDLTDMMTLTENLISGLAEQLTGSTTVTWRDKQINLKAPWPRLDYGELLQKHAGVSHEDVEGLAAKMRAKDLDPEGCTLVDMIDAVFGEYAEPHLNDACFVINQPVEMSPLCRAHPDNPKLAHRFEAFAASMEIANAYSELNDPLEQRKRLQAQQRDVWRKFLTDCIEQPSHQMPAETVERIEKLVRHVQADVDWVPENDPEAVALLDEIAIQAANWKRKEYYLEQVRKLKDPSLLIDEDFLCALEHGMPPAGGLGIGIDRTIMLLAGAASIRDVIPFPLMRPE